MEKKFIATGKDFDSAVQAALKELGLEIEQVSVQLLERAKMVCLALAPVLVRWRSPMKCRTLLLQRLYLPLPAASPRNRLLRNPSRKDQNPLHPSSPHRSLLRKSQRSPRREAPAPRAPRPERRPGSQRQKKNRNLSLKRYLLPPPLAA